MTTSNKTIFVDTNCFIHLRDLTDLPWSDLFASETSIELVVCRQVIRELDTHKHSQRRRLRDRSRKALEWIGKMSNEPDFRIVLRETPRKLTLRLDNSSWPDGETAAVLDRTQPDDRIIAALLTEHLGQPCELLSCDSGPLVLARRLNVTAHRPPDTWYLPDGDDEEQREIARLRRELAAAVATRPSITASFLQGDTPSANLEARIPILPSLPPEIRQLLLAEIQERHPKEDLPESMWPRAFVLDSDPSRGFSPARIEKYGGEYGRFLDKCEKHFEELHKILAQRAHAVCIGYRIENRTAVTALNLLVEYECNGDVLVSDDADGVEVLVGSTAPPPPPKRPKSEYDRMIAPMPDFRPFREEPRDPTGFYYQDMPNMDKPRGSLICEEFRAHEKLELDFYLAPYRELPFEGEIHLRLTATNLAAPVQISTVMRMAEGAASWSDDDVQALLEPWMGALIARHLGESES